MRNETTILTDAIYNAMSNSGEVMAINYSNILDIIVEVETETGVEFTAQEIVICHNKGANDMIDAYVDNEYTYESEYGTVEERVAEWEAQRPQAIRKAKLQKALTILGAK